jgi:hypothetical protein
MKKSSSFFNKIIGLFVFSSSFLIAYGQSGRVIETPQTTPAQTPTPKQSNNESGFVVDANADKYKFVFSPVYDGKLRFVETERTALIKTRHSSTNNFVEQLNLAGEKGYKVVSVIGNDFALVKLDEAQYEYDWFETISSLHFAKSGFEEKLKKASEKGFRLIKHSSFSGNCEAIEANNPAMGETCEYLDFFLVEREKGVKKTLEQILISSAPGWGAKPSAELKQQIEESLAEGFYPVNVFSAFEILLERAKTKDELLSDKPDVQVLRSSWGKGDVKDKVNELSKQGYRLAMTNNRIAVMYRNNETAQIPVSYVWLKADKKNFEKELAKLRVKGAVYKTAYPSDKGRKNTLIFEQLLPGGNQRAEFKILKLEIEAKENKTEGKVYVDLSVSSKEVLKTMNSLVKEGFEVREQFEADGIGIILEKIN